MSDKGTPSFNNFDETPTRDEPKGLVLANQEPMKQAIVPREQRALILEAALDEETRQRELLARYVKSAMVEGTDYGVIPGTKKPTLLKPGAEKLVDLYRCFARFEIIEKIEDFDKPRFHYVFKAEVVSRETGTVMAQGFGSANSMEARYRYRTAWKGGQKEKVENDDIYTLVNTLLKMAKKRALVDASIALARVSDIFTQDLEDIGGDVDAHGGAGVHHDRAAGAADNRSEPNRGSDSGSRAGASAGSEATIKFGPGKDKKLSEATDKELSDWTKRMEEAVAKKDEKWHESNVRNLKSCTAEWERREPWRKTWKEVLKAGAALRLGEATIISVVKAATGKASAKELTEADLPKVKSALIVAETELREQQREK